jgi:hypothetical protein
LFCDNTVVVQSIANNYSKSSVIRDKLSKLHSILHELDSSLVAQHLPGAKNALADNLSRVTLDDHI